jgi:hypothetical protein
MLLTAGTPPRFLSRGVVQLTDERLDRGDIRHHRHCLKAAVMTSVQNRTETVLRGQLLIFRDAGKAMQLDEDRERRLLLLSRESWSQWSAFSQEGPVPNEPSVPVMLRRLGSASYRLAALPSRQKLR